MTNQVSTVQMNTEELNDLLCIAAVKFESSLEKAGMIRSVLYFQPMLDHLREGENRVILRMIRSFPGFAPFIAKNYPELIEVINENVGTICSQI